jgi:exodeoxyribonuclease VII large subunit
MAVRAAGGLSVYARRGTYQLICESLERAGEGDILAMLEERKRKLASEGLFDTERKKSLPLLPSRIGVVTSPTGAAIRDILNVLRRRNSGVNLLILPCSVQGVEAAARIAEQIDTANRYRLCDVLIVGRGGGSLEDLLPFSDELTVRAVAGSAIPIISAVGHEIDLTLSDMASDLRAPTPSSAAEMVAASREELLGRVLDMTASMARTVRQRVDRVNLLLTQFKPENLERNFRFLAQPYLMRLDEARTGLLTGWRERLTTAGHRLEILRREIQAHSPRDTLKRGFAVVTHGRTGVSLISSRQVDLGEDVGIRLYTGNLLAEVKEKKDEIV